MYKAFQAIAILAGACVVSATVACSVDTPLTPAPAPPKASAPADGSTLKATAPALVSPTGDVAIADARPTLIIGASTGQFTTTPLLYEFQLMSDSGALVQGTTQAGTSWTYPSDLSFDTPYRWRARATLSGATGPWSATGRFYTSKVPLPKVTASSSEAEFHAYFNAVILLRGVGPIASAAALSALEPDLVAVGIILEKTSGGTVRGRIYLPTGNPNNLYSRAVDIGDFGKPWQWVYRGGGTVCEGLCK
jgi:hypothetical protein